MLIVMVGGIIGNIILGIFIFWMLTFKYGETYVDNTQLVNGIAPGIIGKQIGLQAGDHITEVDGQPIVRFKDLLGSKVLMGNTTLTVGRDDETMSIPVPGDILNTVADYDRNEFVGLRSRTLAVDSVIAGSVAGQAGIQPGDSMLSINGTAVPFWDQVKDIIGGSTDEEGSVVLLRGDR